jgi:hypothetical protein
MQKYIKVEKTKNFGKKSFACCPSSLLRGEKREVRGEKMKEGPDITSKPNFLLFLNVSAV